jgi:ferrous iron transport protein A
MVEKLSKLKPGQGGVIEEITDEEKVLKLLEMGCIPGENVQLVNIAPSGDPIAINIAGYKLSLRKKDASHILVRMNIE